MTGSHVLATPDDARRKQKGEDSDHGALCDSGTEGLLPAGALDAAKAAEESEREGLEKLGLLIEEEDLSTTVDKIKISQ